MTRPRLIRLAAAALLAGLGTACTTHGKAASSCGPPSPQPSALPTPATAGTGQSQAIHLGTFTTGQTVSFAVPTGTASVTIVEQAASPAVPLTVSAGGSQYPNTPVPLSIDVGQTEIFNDLYMPPNTAFQTVNGVTVLDPLSDPSLSVYFYSAGAWTGALTLPDTSTAIPGTAVGAGVPAGAWTVTVSDWAYECRSVPALGCSSTTFANSSYDVTVILKPSVAPSSNLKVVFYLVTSKLTAATASGNADVQRLEWAMTQILSAAGITPAFAYQDVSSDVRLRYATGVDASKSGACGDMDQLLRLAGPGNQLNVFLVDVIKDTDIPGYTTVGLDPIVPGPASFGGTPASGVLVSTAYLGRVTVSGGCSAGLSIATCGDDVTAAIVAHEAGHFLGLQHTTEQIGTIVDPIGDTGTCLCPNCMPSSAASTYQCQGVGASDPKVTRPYYMQVTDCLQPAGSTPECGGGDNLMFWLIDQDSKGLITLGQAAVMRASPLVE